MSRPSRTSEVTLARSLWFYEADGSLTEVAAGARLPVVTLGDVADEWRAGLIRGLLNRRGREGRRSLIVLVGGDAAVIDVSDTDSSRGAK